MSQENIFVLLGQLNGFPFICFSLPLLQSQDSSEVGDNFSLLEHFLSGKLFLDLGSVTVMVLLTLNLL